MSNEAYSRVLASYFAFAEESTEGTLASDSATDAILIRENGLGWRMGRELIDRGLLTFSLSRMVPLQGIYDDIGFSVQVEGKGSGTQNTEPEIAALLKNAMGSQSDGVNGTVKSSPTPTALVFTVEGTPTITAGHLIRVEVTSGNYEVRRVASVSGSPDIAVTLDYALSAAPGSGNAVQAGNAFILASSGHPTGSAYFYFDGGEKLAMAGCRVSEMKLMLEVGKPLYLDIKGDALSYTPSHATIGYTPSINVTTTPPSLLGFDLYQKYTGVVVTGSTTTSVIVDGGDVDMEIAVGDTLLVYVQSSTAWETKTITAVSGSFNTNKTVTVSALSAAPTADDDLFIIRNTTDCIESMEITLINEIEKIMCMMASSGVAASLPVARSIDVSITRKFRSMQEILMKDNLVGLELMAIIGDTAGNIIAIDMPNFLRHAVDLGADKLMSQTISGGAYQNSSSGDDELFITFL